VVALLALGGVLLVLLSDDDDDDASPATTAEVSVEPTDDGTDSDSGDDDGPEETVETVPGQNADDYPWYETITDDTESITVAVPTEWTDRRTELGTNDLPQVSAATVLLDGFVGTFDEPGMAVAVAAITAESERELDFVLDQYEEPDCTSAGRMNISFPLTGRVERFTDCGASDTKIMHLVFTDEEQGLTAIMRVQIVSDRDDVAVDTIRSSLELEDNVPE
jgi:hypothetical protein